MVATTDVGLLAILLLVLGLVGASSQLGSLSAGTILGPGIGETVRQIGLYWRETSEMTGLFDGFILSVMVHLADKPSGH